MAVATSTCSQNGAVKPEVATVHVNGQIVKMLTVESADLPEYAIMQLDIL